MSQLTRIGWKWPLFILVAAVCLAIIMWPRATKAPGRQSVPSKTSQPNQLLKTRYSPARASSLWVVVNKGRQLPADYVPKGLTVPSVPLRGPASAENMQLRSDAAAALEKLFTAASQTGLKLMLTSGYRSYTTQVAVNRDVVSRHGESLGDRLSAKPGFSEHQTGLAADVEPTSLKCELDQCFGQTPEGKWLLANSYRFGFIIRYGLGQEKKTGYEYEPWHVRYVGKELAGVVYKNGQTLEQYFGLPAVTDYSAKSLTLKL